MQTMKGYIMKLDDLRGKMLSVTFTFEQLAYIVEVLEELAEDDMVLSEIMNVFDQVEIVDEQLVN
jgi:hypothetical protein